MRIHGQITELETGGGVPGVVIEAFDKGHFYDDRVGQVLSAVDGSYDLDYKCGARLDVFERTPDIYLVVKTVAGRVLRSTEGATRLEADTDELINLEIPEQTLRAAGLSVTQGIPELAPARLVSLPCLDRADADPRDRLARMIRRDLTDAGSVLGLMKRYMSELVGEKDNDALPLRKLRKLFKLGSVPAPLDGHYYGVALGLRTGDLAKRFAQSGNLLGYVWGVAVGPTCPWVGKSFAPMSVSDRRQVTGTVVPAQIPVARGVNHLTGNTLLNAMWHLADARADHRLRYGHERDGGHFVAHRAESVYPRMPREVLRLNYRFAGLGNHQPLPHLVEEVVEIAEGLYLGQLLFATARMLEPYDPTADHDIHHYQHCGYFLLFDEAFNGAAQPLFPHLRIPQAAVSTRVPGPAIEPPPPAPPTKFTTLTLGDPPPAQPLHPKLLARVRRDLGDAGTVLRMLACYSEALQHSPTTSSAIFAKLQALFYAGVVPHSMDGFYDGAQISCRGLGLLGRLELTSVKLIWRLLRSVSPWTGMRFDSVTPERLLALTDGHEALDLPTDQGANTLSFRTLREKSVRPVMKLLDRSIELASDAERRVHGYDASVSRFVAKRAPSVAAANGGKPVYQLNYRWKGLRNPGPERLRVDELVQIADGLYLGQVHYASKSRAWSPNTDPAAYEYKLHEYFILMDAQWQSRRALEGRPA